VATDVAALTGSGRDIDVDRGVARQIEDITRLTEVHRLNVAVARFMELTSLLRKGVDAGAGPSSLRDGVAALAVMLSAYAPYTAEEIWSRLGHDVEAGDSVHDTAWPTADPALLVQDTVVCVVQVAGKVRDRMEVSPSIGDDDLRERALASEAVQRALEGRDVRTVIVRAPKLVNVVPV
jgi:leucyl-tRNA synthetase